MNIPIEPYNSGLNDLFFRAADRMRVEGCVNAVANEGLSLALSCVHEALLDHYVQQLLQRLRSAAPEHSLEVYFPANTESLISRFNEVLASQSLREATRNGAARQSAQIWLVHDAQTLPEHELQLLARLIQNFPGANIRAILLMTGGAPTPESLSAFGRKLLRWDIEAPTEEQAQAAVEVARLQGQSEAVTLLLRRIGKVRKTPASWPDDSETADTPDLPLIHAGAAAAPAVNASAKRGWPLALPKVSLAGVLSDLKRHLPPPPERFAKSLNLSVGVAQWQQRRPLLIAGAGALALSVLLMVWLQPSSFGLKDKSAATANAAVSPDPSPVAPANASPVISARSAPLPSTPVDMPQATTDAQAWVRSLPVQNFLIQHSTLASYEKAEQLQRSYTSLREGRIVAAYRPGEKFAHFVLVSGPYENAGKAYERLGRKDMPGTSWVRPVQSLQQQLEPSAKEIR